MTKKSSTIDPARKIKAGRPSAGSTDHVSDVLPGRYVIKCCIRYSRPAIFLVFDEIY